MPALPFTPLTLKFAVEQVLDAANVVNVFHWGFAGAGDSTTDLQTIADAVANAWVTNMLPILSTDLELVAVVATELTSATSPQVTSTVSAFGAVSGDQAPAGTAAVVQKHISRRYRGGHPRSYIAGLRTDDFASPQELTSGFVSSLKSHYDTWAANVSAATTTAYVLALEECVHYHSGNALLAVPTKDVVQSTSIQRRICSQRRRYGPLL